MFAGGTNGVECSLIEQVDIATASISVSDRGEFSLRKAGFGSPVAATDCGLNREPARESGQSGTFIDNLTWPADVESVKALAIF